MRKFLLFLVCCLPVSAIAQFCTPTYLNYNISAGSMGGFNISAMAGTSVADLLPATALTTGYADQTLIVATIQLQQGRSYTGSIDYLAASAYTGNQIWIDFNNDSVFADSEVVNNVFASPSGVAASITSPAFTLNVPMTARTGNHLMRVRNVVYKVPGTPGYAASALNACDTVDAVNQYYCGVTADYLVNIMPLPTCAGRPEAGNLLLPATICPGSAFDVQLENDTIASNLSYQWSSRTAGVGTFNIIGGATSRIYHSSGISVATEFKVQVTCNLSSLRDTTLGASIALTPDYKCYCSSSLGGSITDATLDSIAIGGTSMNISVPGNPNPYTQFDDTGRATATLIAGSTYNFFIKSGGNTHYATHMWVDFNHNNTFDSSEYFRIDSSALPGGLCYAAVTIPVSADTGLTGLRIRTVTDSIPMTASDACLFYYSGQTADMTVRIVTGTACTGTPTAGAAAASVTAACPGASFFLTASGYSSGYDIAFQWYSRPVGGAFVAISGATQSLYTAPGQAAATEYFLKATCPSSGLSDSTGLVTVAENPYYACYCAPQNGVALNDFATAAPLDSVSISGTTLNNYTAGTFAVYANNYPATASRTATLHQGNRYQVYVNSYGTANYNAGLWIDYDHSGTFDPMEFVPIVTNQTPGVPSSAGFTLPVTADTGFTGMRVRINTTGTVLAGGDGCLEIYDGATADYYVTIDSGSACTGRPYAGITSATAANVCASQAFSVKDTLATNTLGITYQWVTRSSATGGVFTPISGATTETSTVLSQTVTTEYAMVATCTISGMSDTSTITTVSEKPFNVCYCAPVTGTTLNDSAVAAPVDSFAIAGTSLNNSTAGSTAVYTQYYPATASTTTSMQRGGTYVVAVKSAGTSAYNANLWIDYNDNGNFESSEFIAVTTSAPSGSVSTVSFTIPTGADTGLTGLRIRTSADISVVSGSDGCSRYTSGATQDYLVRITPATNCSGTPTGGSAIAFSSDVCAGEHFRLGATGFSGTPGTTYQWIVATAGGSAFSAVAGATTPYYTVLGQVASSDYRLVVTCSASGLRDTSSPVTVTNKPFYVCYCAPVTGVTLNLNAAAAPIDSFAVTGTTINNPTPGNRSVYRLFYPVTPTTSDSMRQGFTYTLAIKSNGTSNYNANAWIDYNRNGVFETSEFATIASNRTRGASATIGIYVPLTADTGFTGLRVRTSEHTLLMAPGDACANEADGATEDYVIRLAPGIPCSGTPNAGTAFAPVSAICRGTSFTLTDTGFEVGVGISYQWYSSPAGAGTFSAISGATNSTYLVTSQSVSTDYRFVATCTVSGISANSNVVTVAQTPYFSCYCGALLGTSETSTAINNFNIAGSTLRLSVPFSGAHRTFGMVGDSTGTIQRSLPYTLNLNVAGGMNFNAGMWIDYDHSGTFETSEYVRIDTNRTSGSTSTITFTIPGIADTGITGLRVRATRATNSMTGADACTNYYYSQTYDFKIKIDTLVRCNTPVAGTITSTSPFACPAMTFQLSNDGYNVASGMSYQWIKRTGATFASIAGATTHSLTVSGQMVSTDYALVARCSLSGRSDTSTALSIVENPFDSCYCSPPTGVALVTAGGDTDILVTSIVGTTMYVPTQSPDSNGYVSVPPTPSYNTATLQRTFTYPITVYVNSAVHTISDAGLWIDYNHNSLFDAAEYLHLTQSADHSNWSGNIAIPATSLLGNTGMRVVTTHSGSLTASGACATISAGQVQDHIITITRPPCYSISAISVTGITDSSARGHWNTLSGAAGYEYVIDTSVSAPTGSGILTTDTFAQSACLRSATTYFLHVRDSCDAGYFSGWVTTSFTTLTCDSVTTLRATAVTNHTATISWGAVSGSTGYEYVIDTLPGTPTGSLTAFTGTTLNLTALNQGTVYYAHVRSGCHCSNSSLWQTVSFTTICDTITHLSIAGITDTSVTITWDSIIGSSRYAYVVDTSSASPSGSGSVTTATTARVIGLSPGSTYYAHVSHDCSGGYSYWTTIRFTTSYCDTISGLSATASDTGIVFSFSPVSGGLGYYYVVNYTPGAPTATGTFTTSTTDTVTGLLSSTLYYVHVRTGCSGGRSGWKTIAITTHTCDTVTGFAVTGICDTNALLTWNPSASGPGYLFAVTTTPTIVGTPGSYSLATSVSYSALSPGTIYYAHVRHLCSFVDTSAPVTIMFTTPACDSITGLHVGSVTSSTAALSWTPSPCAGGYNWVVDGSPFAPGVTGTFTSSANFTATTLTPGTTYYAHVQVNCGGGVTSTWVTIPFTTTLCDPTASLTVTGITDIGATLNWAAVAGATGYEYAVDLSATAPSSGTGGSGTSQVVAPLVPLTNYYAHLRAQCGTGIYSSWVTTPFSTTNLAVQTLHSGSFALQAYPNPVTEDLDIRVTGGGNNRTVFVTDLTGKVIITKAMLADSLELNLTQLASGVYFVRYVDDSHTQTMKINKQ